MRHEQHVLEWLSTLDDDAFSTYFLSFRDVYYMRGGRHVIWHELM